jgi:hypothetical protein
MKLIHAERIDCVWHFHYGREGFELSPGKNVFFRVGTKSAFMLHQIQLYNPTKMAQRQRS